MIPTAVNNTWQRYKFNGLNTSVAGVLLVGAKWNTQQIDVEEFPGFLSRTRERSCKMA
jgi:hypothetical protein